jgi:hypothetical protein
MLLERSGRSEIEGRSEGGDLLGRLLPCFRYHQQRYTRRHELTDASQNADLDVIGLLLLCFFYIFPATLNLSGLPALGRGGLFDMEVLEPAAILASILAMVSFLFLFTLARGLLSDRQQTGAWIAYSIVFFSVFTLLFRNADAGAVARRPLTSPAVIDTTAAGVRR